MNHILAAGNYFRQNQCVNSIASTVSRALGFADQNCQAIANRPPILFFLMVVMSIWMAVFFRDFAIVHVGSFCSLGF